MSNPQLRETQHERLSDDTTAGNESQESALKRVYHNNKGVFLILLAQVAGSSMDAIARFLQLSAGGMHPFQVCYTILIKYFLNPTHKAVRDN
jgi:hypothetical protein